MLLCHYLCLSQFSSSCSAKLRPLSSLSDVTHDSSLSKLLCFSTISQYLKKGKHDDTDHFILYLRRLLDFLCACSSGCGWFGSFWNRRGFGWGHGLGPLLLHLSSVSLHCLGFRRQLEEKRCWVVTWFEIVTPYQASKLSFSRFQIES